MMGALNVILNIIVLSSVIITSVSPEPVPEPQQQFSRTTEFNPFRQFDQNQNNQRGGGDPFFTPSTTSTTTTRIPFDFNNNNRDRDFNQFNRGQQQFTTREPFNPFLPPPQQPQQPLPFDPFRDILLSTTTTTTTTSTSTTTPRPFFTNTNNNDQDLFNRNRDQDLFGGGLNRDRNRDDQQQTLNRDRDRDQQFGINRDRDQFGINRDRDRDRDRDQPFGINRDRDRDRDQFGINRDRDRQTDRDQFGRPFVGSTTRDPFNPFNTFTTQSPRINPFNNPFNNNNNPFGFGQSQPGSPFDTGTRNFNPNFGGGLNRFDFGDNTFAFSSFEQEKVCPPGWEAFQLQCYRFIRSPIHNRVDAQRNCQAYGNGADLMSINGIDEHSWLVRRLNAIDPQHRKWYISTRQNSPGSWTNSDNTPLVNLDEAFLRDQPLISLNQNNNYLAYSFDYEKARWGLLRVTGLEDFLYICEIPLSQVPYIISDDRDFEYGNFEILDKNKIPMGPKFIKQPEDAVFDLSRSRLRTYISLNCLASGWPAPNYHWYKEEYMNNTLVSIPIDPLLNSKYTISGGSLIIDSPQQLDDRGSYHCQASNMYGSIVSETVSISFGYIGEFILARSTEIGQQYWGKAIYCDPPQHFPGVHYYWARKYFPNFVEEDQRVFVSYDGNLYISAVDMSDQDQYSCNVQSTVSDSGRNGPLFSLQVVSNANYQQLKFPNNFPKVFPETPVAGKEVRLECVSFGYPVPSYNWTRKGYGLPRGVIQSNYNRVLTIPRVRVEDQGEYICRATNSRLSMEGSVTLSIQARPVFTIPLTDKHMDKGDDLQWTCEAFGIPDVQYQWYRNGHLLNMETLNPDQIGRYYVQDNVLTIKDLHEDFDGGMYQCRANNSLDATFSAAQLRILLLAPSFKKRPLDQEILGAEGGNLTIVCSPEAAPRPKFAWRKDSNLIGSGGKRRILPNGNLYISPVSRDDEGIYTCIAQNALGTDESTGRVQVLRGPRLVEAPPDRARYTVGGQMTLHCRADMDETLDSAYIWKHNGIRIDEITDDPYRIRMDSRIGFLEIFNLSLVDKGQYECEVNTWVGMLRTITTIDIRGPPGPPGGVQASDLTATSARVQWTDGSSNGALPFMYTIEGRTQWDTEWTPLAENVTVTALALDASRVLQTDTRQTGRIAAINRKEIILGPVLSPWSTYEFRVFAANEYGYGPASFGSPSYNTHPDVPFVAPRNIGGGGGKTGSLTITWDPLPPKYQNSRGIYYKIYWRLIKEGVEDEFQTLELPQWGNIGMFVVSVPSQYYYTLYEVQVQAINEMGKGPISAPSQIYSAEDMPQVAPSLVTPRPYNSTAINVTWIPVEESRDKIRGELIGYRIRYWLKVDTNLYDAEAINYLSRSKNPWALIVGLQPNIYYYVQVMAYNSAGPGPASEPQFERTLKKAPSKPPTAVTVHALDPSTIRVTWRYVAPSIDEEAIQGYKIRIWYADMDMSSANDTSVRIGSQRLQLDIGNLQPGKQYILRVLAYSLGGDGKMSSPAQEFILGDPEYLKSYTNKYDASLFITLFMTMLTIIVKYF